MSLSNWTHAICPSCFAERRPGASPVVVVDKVGEPCCYCGALTGAGIYYRSDPGETLCHGEGSVHEGGE